MITVEGGEGHYEFEFINECSAEEVYSDVTYSSDDFRPLNIVINGGDVVDEYICSARGLCQFALWALPYSIRREYSQGNVF